MGEKPACSADYEKFAQKMLSPPMFNFISGSSKVQDSDDFFKIQLKLRGMANLKYFTDPIKTQILGTTVESPIIMAPFPHQGMMHKDGELASAQAAAEMNQLFVLSSESTFSIEQVVEATKGKGPKMLEIDLRLPDPVIFDLVKRVSQQDCFIGIVVNAQFISNRITENEWKNDFIIPPYLNAGSLKKYQNQFGTSDTLRDCYGMVAPGSRNGQPFKLQDLQSIKNQARSGMKMVVKGIMTTDDALNAMDNGADAIWVSNGCHLKPETAPSTISVLACIAHAFKAKYPDAEIIIDSGLKRGTDVLKCIAMGATSVAMGKPVMWGLVYNGCDGVKDIFNMLNEEVKLGMALTHCFKLTDVTEKQIIHGLKARM